MATRMTAETEEKVSRRILVTSALPYANGSIHLGHLVEYIMTDIWVRYFRLRGWDAHYFCADDTHGTPVMIRAMREGIEPEALIERMHTEHLRDFTDFGIQFDNYYTTHSPENERWARYIYERLADGGHLTRRDVEQTYCEHDRLFLPDRLVRGTCPRCGALDQYGDSCESCGATYEPTELGDARCTICGSPPVRRTTEHIYVRLSDFTEVLKAWTRDHLQRDVANYVGRWLDEGLRDWDISRDGPYFGFEIPGEENVFFYVWLDAPIGYIASTENWCHANGRSVDEFWRDPDAEIYHVIGKDIVYFHTLFWPAMLHAAGLNLPRRVHVHGFLLINGEKMSKSRGTFINGRTYLDHLDPQYLRFYYAAKTSAKSDDIDLVFKDFVNRVNAELVNKIANLYSRTLKLVGNRLDGRLGTVPAAAREMISAAEAAAEPIAAAYERCDLAEVMLRISQLAEQGNQYLQEAAPWKAIQDDPELARDICTAAATLGARLAVYLKPVLPEMVAKIETTLGVGSLTWDDLGLSLEGRSVGEFERLVDRLDIKRLDGLVEASREEMATSNDAGAPEGPFEPLEEECTIDDFARIDLRVARVVQAETVEGAKKLIKLQLDLGGLGQRTVFAGIRSAYPDPEVLVGRLVICVANLAPRTMRFGVSEGMVCAASRPEGAEDPCIRVIEAAPDSRPGDRVR
jgi:methionyl-tRNA synthetase